MTTRAEVTQCRTCPWKVGCDPLTDIPDGYSVALHEKLRGTIAEPGSLAFLSADRVRIMACHYSTPGEERVCAGWLNHQLRDGNNVWARIEVMRGRLPVPVVEGEQHVCFEDTLPKVCDADV